MAHVHCTGLQEVTFTPIVMVQVVAQGSEEIAIFHSQWGYRGRISSLTVQMRTPFSHTSRPTVQFQKQGALSEEELAVFSAVLRTANMITADKAAGTAQVSHCFVKVASTVFVKVGKSLFTAARYRLAQLDSCSILPTSDNARCCSSPGS